MPVVTSIATVAVVLALVNVAKEFGVKGKWATLLAVFFGIILSVLEYVFTADVVTMQGLYQAFAVGLLIGLTAAGVYDVSKAMGGSTQVVNVPIVSPSDIPTDAVSEFPEITEADLIPYATHDSGEAEYDPKVMPGVAQSKQG